ncbi:MAG: hypothetical protein HWE08_07965 [Alphaproteobacteria bacterium]|nr:hypothetical protein [Alphaproteobacteria bacterium]
MRMTPKLMRRFLIVAGLSVSSLALAGTSSAMIAADDDEKVEKEEKKEKRTIRVIRSGDRPVTVIKRGDHKIIAHSAVEARLEEQERARAEATAALAEVSKRLEKSRSKSEKAALKAAQKGLMAAIEALEERRTRHVVMGPSRVEIARIEAEAMEHALKELEIREGELTTMRIELKDELAEAREEIEEALGELDIELDMDGDIRALRLKSLKTAEVSLEEMEKEHLEALKRAEKEIKRERERLEERLKERKEEADKKDN